MSGLLLLTDALEPSDEILPALGLLLHSVRVAPAEGSATLCGIYVETDDRSGLARRIAPIRIGGRLEPALPDLVARAAD